MAFLLVIGGLLATLNSVSRLLRPSITFDTDIGTINPALGSGISVLSFLSGVVWSNVFALIAFTALLGAAVINRRRADIHKRLILVASISIVGPAVARISRLGILGGEQGPSIPVALLTLLAAIVVHDLVTLRKVHKASLAAIILVIALSIGGDMFAARGFGLELVHNLGK